MFMLLPWTVGRYHMLLDGEKIGYCYIDDGAIRLCFTPEIDTEDMKSFIKEIESQYKKDGHPTRYAEDKAYENKQLKELAGKIPAAIQNTKKGKLWKYDVFDATKKVAAKTHRSSKWDQYMDGKQHTLTVKQTGAKSIESARMSLYQYAKVRGYEVATYVKGGKLTICKN